MNETVRRKLNILVYLAKIDGKFHKSEKALLTDFVKQHNFDPEQFKSLVEEPEKLEPEKVVEKKELMFLALKLIKADEILDPLEMDFCKSLAEKLGFKPELVNYFADSELTKEYFEKEIENWVHK
jgi:tellurite resistance protein